jgi:hypothetical protein
MRLTAVRFRVKRKLFAYKGAKKAVDGLSGSLQSRSKLVESPIAASSSTVFLSIDRTLMARITRFWGSTLTLPSPGISIFHGGSLYAGFDFYDDFIEDSNRFFVVG